MEVGGEHEELAYNWLNINEIFKKTHPCSWWTIKLLKKAHVFEAALLRQVANQNKCKQIKLLASSNRNISKQNYYKKCRLNY